MIFYGNIKQQLTTVLANTSYSKLFVLTDNNTTQHCLPIIKPIIGNFHHIEMPAGEQHKTITTCEIVWNNLLHNGADRNSFLLCLGGGVVTDLGGFVAGAYKRGIRFCNIPTSLLAMVDASVGSKTGVDFGNVKNSIGLFNEAEAVLIDDVFLQTLPQQHVLSGKAEMLKHGLIANQHHFANTLANMNQIPTLESIKNSIAIKAEVVAQDPTEQGLRKVLNFGHSLGHAIESYSLTTEQNSLLHGEAIAIGMIAEAKLSEKYTQLSAQESKRIEHELVQHYLIPNYSISAIEQMMNYLENDKKNEANELRMSLLSSIGKAEYNIAVSKDDAFEALRSTLQISTTS